MILAIDSYYFDDKAKTVMIGFEDWTQSIPTTIVQEITEGVADYEPGSFYKRELPCILNILNKADLEATKAIIIDGFVVLDDDGKPGLGGRLYEALGQTIPVIGVAKTGFHNNKKHVQEVFRGVSKRPLFVTARGIALDIAAEHIVEMHGKFRIPSLLQMLDGETKKMP